jgi:Fe2+ transport system protein FeoA
MLLQRQAFLHPLHRLHWLAQDQSVWMNAVKAHRYALQAQSLFGAQDERVTLRLKELGFLPGALLKVIGFGLMGSDPLAVQVNGTKFALRRAEAAKIRVELIAGSH